MRDWAAEGELEREQAFACVLDAVNSAFSQPQDEVEVLVPGSGLNRLGQEIANLQGKLDSVLFPSSHPLREALRFPIVIWIHTKSCT